VIYLPCIKASGAMLLRPPIGVAANDEAEYWYADEDRPSWRLGIASHVTCQRAIDRSRLTCTSQTGSTCNACWVVQLHKLFQLANIDNKVTSRFTVAEWLTHLAATLEVMGSRPSLGVIYEIYFLESIQSPAQRVLKWSVRHCGTYCELNCGVNW